MIHFKNNTFYQMTFAGYYRIFLFTKKDQCFHELYWESKDKDHRKSEYQICFLKNYIMSPNNKKFVQKEIKEISYEFAKTKVTEKALEELYKKAKIKFSFPTVSDTIDKVLNKLENYDRL